MFAPKELLLPEKQFLKLRPSLWTKAETWDVVVAGSLYFVVDEETLLVVVPQAQQTRNIRHNLKEEQKALVVGMMVCTNW